MKWYEAQFKAKDYETETWVDLPEMNGRYQISSLGRIRATYPDDPEKPFYRVDTYGHVTVSLYALTDFYIASAVANLFVPNPNRYSYIGFKNGNARDCRACNLEWIPTDEWERSLYQKRTCENKYSDEARCVVQYSKLKELLIAAYKSGANRLACGDADGCIERTVNWGEIESVRDSAVQVPEGKGNIKLLELGLSVRAFNTIVRALPRPIRQAESYTVMDALIHIKDLMEMRNCGFSLAAEIIDKFEAAGIPVPEWKKRIEGRKRKDNA